MITLEKKKSISLTKAVPALNHVRVGLSWDETVINGQKSDADASVFMLGESGKIPSDDCFVFYNNTTSGDGSVRHSGDNRTGAGDGDDESIDIALMSVSSNVEQIIIAVTLANPEAGFHFGNVRNASIRVYNSANNSAICEYQMTESYADCDGVIIGRFYRMGSEWEFEAMGQAFGGGLQALLDLYN
jgi:tellurium resistance protein TerD